MLETCCTVCGAIQEKNDWEIAQYAIATFGKYPVRNWNGPRVATCNNCGVWFDVDDGASFLRAKDG